jgi:7,8-dihydro-6-hydroxymethylpterin-pyrophosphokinase
MHLRRFVLAPLVELQPDLIHPRLGVSVVELLARLPLVPQVHPVARTWLPAEVLEASVL